MSSDVTSSPKLQPIPSLPPLPEAPAHVLLFIAMRAEAEPVARALGISTSSPSDPRPSEGVHLCIPGDDATTGIDRIGPVYAAWALTRAIAAARPDVVVNLGTSGGFEAQGVAIADLVIARETVFHDARVALEGFDRVARSHLRLSPQEPELARFAERLGARVGLVSSGSSLDATPAEMAGFRVSQALAKDMELAALAAVCAVERIPLVAVKSITDLVDHHEPTHEACLRNLDRASRRLADAAPRLLATMRP